LIRVLINIYIIILIIDAILSYYPNLNHYIWVQRIHKVANVTLNPVRKYLPKELPFDVSPIIVILGLKLIEVLW